MTFDLVKIVPNMVIKHNINNDNIIVNNYILYIYNICKVGTIYYILHIYKKNDVHKNLA